MKYSYFRHELNRRAIRVHCAKTGKRMRRRRKNKKKKKKKNNNNNNNNNNNSVSKHTITRVEGCNWTTTALTTNLYCMM
jgi:hypothetical protein